MKRKIIIVTASIAATLLLLLVLFIVGTKPGHYLFALMQEYRWHAADPHTKSELEQYLCCYKTREIEPSKSMWGHDYKLTPDEKMIQYLIMWDETCPLDVVYDKNDNIKAIFTSYE